MKRAMALILASVMAISLTACGGAPTAESGTEKGTEAPAEGTQATSGGTLTVAVWDKNQEPGITQIINDFTAETGIKAKVQVTPWEQYWTMLEAGATGGSLPDVFWMHSNEFSKYAEYEMLMNLTDKIAGSDKLDMTKFPQDIVEIYNWQGEAQYAIPKDMDTIALWYNKTMFDEAGIEYPSADWTWDDFKSACEKLTKEDGSQFGYAAKPSNNQDGWYNMVYNMGGYIISEDKKSSGYDQPGTIKAIEFISGLVNDGLTPSPETMSENPPEALFEAGKVGMITMGSWMLAELCNNDYVKANCDIAVLPKDAASGRRASIYNGLGWVASANTSRPDDAWALVEYMGSEKAQKKQSDLGVVISAYEGTEANWTKAYPDFNLQAYLDMKEDLVIRPYSKTTVAWEEMSTEKLVNVWSGTKSAEEACKEIAAEMNAKLAEE